MEDDGFSMFESGAMVEWVLERYGQGRLRPPLASAESALYLQWSWFAEATLARPLGDIAQHTLLKPEAERIPAVVDDSRKKALLCLEAVDAAVADRDYLLTSGFSAADIMMGYSLVLAKRFEVLTDSLPNAESYFRRLGERPAFAKAMAA